MKYSLRSLTIVVGVVPPLLAGAYFLVGFILQVDWRVFVILSGWSAIAVVAVAVSVSVPLLLTWTQRRLSDSKKHPPKK